MASTYVNDLRLNEMATGDQSGSWGTVTNTNLELIAEAFSYGTEAITTNADTHTTTIADGGTDPGRSMFLKYTGTLDSACTITIGPNTVSKLWFIENATSGSQNIIIKQGSGATVTIASGKTKVIYSDGVGSGAKMVDAFAALDVGNLTVEANAPYINISNTGENVGGIKMYDSAGASTQYFHLTYDAGASNTVGFDTGASGEYAFSVNGTSMFNIASTGAATFNSTIAAGAATFTTADNTNQLTLVSTDADANAGPNLNLRRNSASPADGDLTGQLTFTNNNDAGEGTDYVTIHALSADVSNGSEDAAFYIKTMSAGTLRQRISLTDTATVFNEDSIDLDFRVESDANTHMLFVDAGNNRIGIGTSTPAAIATIKTASNEEDALLIEQADGTDVGSLSINNGSFILKGKNASSPVQIQTHDGNEDIEVDPDGFIKMETAGSERLRIDASGRVLIDTTNISAIAQQGNSMTYDNGRLEVQKYRDPALRVGNYTDGFSAYSSNLVEFYSGGTSVGSIGTSGGNPYFAQASKGIGLSSARMYPVTNTGAVSDNTMDIGNTNARWKDVHAVNYYGNGSNLTGISSGGVTLLGSVASTSNATSLGLSNLDLSGYKILWVIGNWLTGNTNTWFGLQSPDNYYQIANTINGGQSDVGTNFWAQCDLTTGVTFANAARANKRYQGTWQNSGSTGSGGNLEYIGGTQITGITNSTTTVTLYTRSGYNFGYNSGNISGTERKMYLYGVA